MFLSIMSTFCNGFDPSMPKTSTLQCVFNSRGHTSLVRISTSIFTSDQTKGHD